MDFMRLVENGDYKLEDLTEDQKQLINGLDMALDTVSGMYQVIAEDDSVLETIEKQVTNEVLSEVERYIYSTRCEAIVTLNDHNFEKENENE